MIPREAYQQIASPEGDTAFGVPLLAVQEFPGIVEDLFLDPDVEDDRAQRSLGTRSDKSPLVLNIG